MSRALSGTSPEQVRTLDGVKGAPSLGEHNMNENEQTIRQRAYEIWDNAGRPDDRSDEFWFAAITEFEREEETNLSSHVPPHVGPSRHEQ